MMAQRALPNPYADYDKSLATSYFDAAGRVSGAGARRPWGCAAAVWSRVSCVVTNAVCAPCVDAHSPAGVAFTLGGFSLHS